MNIRGFQLPKHPIRDALSSRQVPINFAFQKLEFPSVTSLEQKFQSTIDRLRGESAVNAKSLEDEFAEERRGLQRKADSDKQSFEARIRELQRERRTLERERSDIRQELIEWKATAGSLSSI